MPRNCAVSESLSSVFALLGKRWSGLIIGALLEFGPAHFAELRHGIPGISERILSTRLTELADAGLVIREVEPGPPVGVVYRLTASGEALRPALAELAKWASEHIPTACPTAATG